MRYDMLLEQGASFSVSFEWRENDGSDPPAGPLVDTSGYVPHMQIKTKPGGTVLATFTEGSGLSVADGVITLALGADVTGALTRGGQYDLELRNAADPTDVVRLVQGTVRLSRAVTTG